MILADRMVINSMAPYVQLGTRIKLARVVKNYSQQQLADLAQVSYFQVMRAETQNQYVGQIALRRIKLALGIE